MGFFSSPVSYLGVDFDSKSVKICELKNENGRPKLVTYGYSDPLVEGDKEVNIEKTAELIKAVCKKAQVSSTKVISSLPAFSVFSSIISLPQMNKKELASAIRWEAKKVVPLPAEEMILDWQVLEDESLPESPALAATLNVEPGKNSNDTQNFQERKHLKIKSESQSQQQRILLTAVSQNLVQRHMQIFKHAGLQLISLDTETFALIRSLVGRDKSSIMLVDMGSLATSITVVTGGIPYLTRSIDVGGLTITKAIANSLNISLQRSEQFKYDIGLETEGAQSQSVPETVMSVLTPVLNEIKYTKNLYQNKNAKSHIEKIILTGGSSLLAGLPEYLSKELDMKAYIGDPWSRVIYPQDLKPVLDEIGPRFSPAVGLAMRNIV